MEDQEAKKTQYDIKIVEHFKTAESFWLQLAACLSCRYLTEAYSTFKSFFKYFF